MSSHSLWYRRVELWTGTNLKSSNKLLTSLRFRCLSGQHKTKNHWSQSLFWVRKRLIRNSLTQWKIRTTICRPKSSVRWSYFKKSRKFWIKLLHRKWRKKLIFRLRNVLYNRKNRKKIRRLWSRDKTKEWSKRKNFWRKGTVQVKKLRSMYSNQNYLKRSLKSEAVKLLLLTCPQRLYSPHRM